jgi:hypothetical protein
MISDLGKVRTDAIQLAHLSDEQLLQPDSLTMLNEMKTLTTEVNSGWFDAATGVSQGGVLWVSARIQQLVTISLAASNQQ